MWRRRVWNRITEGGTRGILLLLAVATPGYLFGNPPEKPLERLLSDTTSVHTDLQNLPSRAQELHNAWGMDVLISNDGFGLGLFYRREFTPDLYGFVSLSVAEAKEDREVELVDYFGNTFVPGKLNRFMVIPLTFGIQRRLFREEIMDTFRPYVNAGVGPTMIYAAPYTDVVTLPSGGLLFKQVEFFESLGRGKPYYTFGSYIGFGANFGSDQTSLFGVNFRYYFTYLFNDGIPSLYDSETGQPAQNKTSFGGFYITLNVGMLY
jgi:hypothetical protein